MERVLMIDDENKAKVARVKQYAEQPANWYRPFSAKDTALKIPGDNPQHVCNLNSYRCVYTITVAIDQSLFKQLSISVPGEFYPHPTAAMMIATMFGFTGWNEQIHDRLPEGWLGSANKEDHCIILVQPHTVGGL